MQSCEDQSQDHLERIDAAAEKARAENEAKQEAERLQLASPEWQAYCEIAWVKVNGSSEERRFEDWKKLGLEKLQQIATWLKEVES